MARTDTDFKKWRKGMGWTIEQAANALEKNYRTIQRYERDQEPEYSVMLACALLTLQKAKPDLVSRTWTEFRGRNKIKATIA